MKFSGEIPDGTLFNFRLNGKIVFQNNAVLRIIYYKFGILLEKNSMTENFFRLPNTYTNKSFQNTSNSMKIQVKILP